MKKKILLSIAVACILGFAKQSAAQWQTTGNAGTNITNNFIGTTDNAGLRFRTNNTDKMLLTSDGKFVIGAFTSPVSALNVSGDVDIKSGILRYSGVPIARFVTSSLCIGNSGVNITSAQNCLIGTAGNSLTTAAQNTMIGINAGPLATSNGNVFVGCNTAISLTSGANNTVLGSSAGFGVTSGGSNVFIGNGAGTSPAAARTNSIAIGAGSFVNLDNCAVIGGSSVNKLGIGTTPSAANIIQFASGTTTAKLTTGGAWTNASDRKLKDNIQQLDKKEILEKINKLEVARWHYKADAEMRTHIGPFAKDFFEAFKTGDDSTISTIDPSGVALVGVQQLSIENETLSSEVRNLTVKTKVLESENEELKSRLVKIEELLNISTSEKEAASFQKLVLESEGKTAVLGQNIPNPFNGKTIINYYLPQDVKSAQLVITTSNGITINKLDITSRGQGSVEIDATKLAGGNYHYSLVVNGVVSETKQFSLVK